ncbi:MAG TPA: cupin domain-containing protein [Candidatus Dormibacteraeota bacterium]|jgi:anti-sigma factor ChrR (cupin superfamily)|nr:cupin domain-containing protein [Candidatus Dormibacteraeota bacterium]
MNLEGVFAVHADGVAPVDLYPGIRKRTPLSSDCPTGTRILLVEIDPGHRFLELDVHQPGPEEVYVLEGIFHDGAREYPAGSFIHNPVGSSHIPQSATGCKLLVIFPQG